jgi:hypothetical protein
MAVRLTSYVSLLYEDMIKSKQLRGAKHLPPVLPIVFYNGSTPWTATQQSIDLLSPAAPALFKNYFPQIHYELLDIGHYPLTPAQYNDKENPLMPLIALEQCPDDSHKMLDYIHHLGTQLASSKFDSLRRAFVVYLAKSLELQKRCPGIDPEKLNLREFETVLRDKLQAYEDRLAKKNLEQGMQQGMQRVMQVVALKMLQEKMDDKIILKITNCFKAELAAIKAEEICE